MNATMNVINSTNVKDVKSVLSECSRVGIPSIKKIELNRFLYDSNRFHSATNRDVASWPSEVALGQLRSCSVRRHKCAAWLSRLQTRAADSEQKASGRKENKGELLALDLDPPPDPDIAVKEVA